LFMTHNT